MTLSEFKKYIGGEIEISEEFLGIPQRKNTELEQQYTLCSSGRQALKIILQEINLNNPVLLPSYLCESVIQPLKELNIKYEFYRINTDLSIDQDYLKMKLKSKKFSVFLFINYFGFIEQNIDLDQIRNMQNEIIFIEDNTHLTFIPQILQKYKYRGDYVFGSLRKIFSIPDGGFILGNKYSISSDSLKRSMFSELKFYGKLLRNLNIKKYQDHLLESVYLKLLELSEQILDTKIPDDMISEISMRILSNMDFEDVIEKREKNYNYLKNLFKEDSIISAVGELVRNDASPCMPYMLPFYFKRQDRNIVRKELIKRNIFTSIIWKLPEEVENMEFQPSLDLSRNVLCFPVDQRYDVMEMDYIYQNFKEVLLNEKRNARE